MVRLPATDNGRVGLGAGAEQPVRGLGKEMADRARHKQCAPLGRPSQHSWHTQRDMLKDVGGGAKRLLPPPSMLIMSDLQQAKLYPQSTCYTEREHAHRRSS